MESSRKNSKDEVRQNEYHVERGKQIVSSQWLDTMLRSNTGGSELTD